MPRVFIYSLGRENLKWKNDERWRGMWNITFKAWPVFVKWCTQVIPGLNLSGTFTQLHKGANELKPMHHKVIDTMKWKTKKVSDSSGAGVRVPHTHLQEPATGLVTARRPVLGSVMMTACFVQWQCAEFFHFPRDMDEGPCRGLSTQLSALKGHGWISSNARYHQY